MENLEKTIIFENVQNLIFSKAYKINALQGKIDFSSRSKDGYVLRSLKGQKKVLMKEFVGFCEMAYACGYDVNWSYKNDLIVIGSIDSLDAHSMLSVHHYYEREAEGLV